MASLAFLTERAAMHIVLVVTCPTDQIERGRTIYGFVVALVAIQADMGTRQRETRLRIVVEAGTQPPIGVVTLATFRSKPALVERILVAGLAQHRRFLEVLFLVTIGAWHRLVAADQRETRLVVVEFGDGLPVHLIVAAVALGAELAFMNIVLPMATDACQRQLDLKDFVLVASIASDLAVSSAQREIGLLMVELGGFLPGRLVMTTGAFLPQTIFVYVVFLVAAYAG